MKFLVGLRKIVLEIIKTFLLAMTPIGELRAAIPVGLTVYKLHWATAYFVAVLGNLVPVVFLLLFLEPVSKFLSKRFKIFEKFFNWLFARTRQKVEYSPWLRQMSELRRAKRDRAKKCGWLVLIPFVAIPLPITGAWTGSLVAFLFKIPFKKAFPAITAGVLLAGMIVSVATGAGIAIEKYFGWETLLTILVIGGVVLLVLKKTKKTANSHDREIL